jgi:hypothetical protein
VLRPPARAGIGMSVTKQKQFELLPHPTLVVHGIFACANQIADGFVLRLRNHNRHKFPSTVKSGKQQGIARVGLDPVGRPSGDSRWGNDLAVVAVFALRSHEFVAAQMLNSEGLPSLASALVKGITL